MKLGTKKGDESLEKYMIFCLDKYNKRANSHALEAADDENQGNYDRERTQRTVLATWLLEIKLNMLEDAQNQVKRDKVFNDCVKKMESEFFEFINREIHNLDEDSIFQLLQSHGRIDYCLKLAQKFKNYEETLVIHCVNKQEYKQALQTIELVKDYDTRFNLTLKFGLGLSKEEPSHYI